MPRIVSGASQMLVYHRCLFSEGMEFPTMVPSTASGGGLFHPNFYFTPFYLQREEASLYGYPQAHKRASSVDLFLVQASIL